ncbi:MAG: aspartate-semialdehyde dehydrogenase [Opitutales bacterium]
MAQQYRIGIVGATGAVGKELLELLIERAFPAKEIRLYASARSAGKTIEHSGKTYTIEETTPEIFADIDIAIFSAGSSISKDLAWEAAQRDCVVIDNSSAFRMDPRCPLVVPEVNPFAAKDHQGVIANPNCSTAITLMGLYPLHEEFGLIRYFASTYQSASGAGAPGMAELEAQAKSWVQGEEIKVDAFAHQLLFNLIPHVDVFQENGYTKEEMKFVNESRKILDFPNLRASSTCVRVPVLRAHSIAVQAEFEKPVDVQRAREVIAEFEGSELIDEPENLSYPMPLDYAAKVPCGVGRIRKDLAFDNGLSFFVVGDQLWKGAALNAVQIAELLVEREWLSPIAVG